MRGKNLLLIEDNPRIQMANVSMLEASGFIVDTAMSLAQAREQLALKVPDAVVLDIMLPDGSGLDFIGEIRQRSNVPILLLTARSTDDDTVLGLSSGADDYLSKPYDYKVLLARIEALLRRSGHVPDMLVREALTLNIPGGQAFLHGRDLMLTAKEFSCLLVLVQNEGRILPNESLYRAVWNMPLLGDSQAIRTVINRLRKKLSDSEFSIKSSRSMGYKFDKG